MKKNETDQYVERIIRPIEQHFLRRELRGMSILLLFLLVAISIQWDAKARAPEGVPSCEQLRQQFADPTGDCTELQARYQTATNFSNFPG